VPAASRAGPSACALAARRAVFSLTPQRAATSGHVAPAAFVSAIRRALGALNGGHLASAAELPVAGIALRSRVWWHAADLDRARGRLVSMIEQIVLEVTTRPSWSAAVPINREGSCGSPGRPG